MAPCCSPIPGDEVFGFITINDGIKIHKVSCPNAKELMANYGYRVVSTSWNDQRDVSFLTGLKITGFDKLGLVNSITRIISNNENINMRNINIDTNDGIFEGNIKLYVQGTDQLNHLIAKLKEVDGVEQVMRIDN
jgi:GTP pyrophosphokinase